MLAGYYDYQAQAQTLSAVLPSKASIPELGVGTELAFKELLALKNRVTGMDHTNIFKNYKTDLLPIFLGFLFTEPDLRRNGERKY